MNILDDLKLQFKIGDVTTKLIFWNIALFAIPFVVFGLLRLFNIQIDFISYVSLNSNPIDLLWKPWSILTYSFFHTDIFHILFNLVMLNFAGRMFLTFFTQKQLLSLYLLSAIFAGFVYIFSYMLFPALVNLNTSLIGASGAVMAVLVATAVYQPLMDIRLFLFGNVKLWHIVLVFLVIDLIQLPMNNTGGHLAHLGGAFFGYIYIKMLKNGTDITKWFSTILDFFTNLFSKSQSTPFKKVHKNYNRPIEKRTSKIITKDKSQQQIDEILDKISKSGYDCLTKEEKEFLFKAGK